MNRQDIINEIKRTAETNGGSPFGSRRFAVETGICESDWNGKYWARWSDALVEAGYTPNTLQSSYDDEWVIGKLVCLIRELGRFPSDADLRLKATQDKNFPSVRPFRRLGNKAELIEKTIGYCEIVSELNDVLSICRALEGVRSEPDISSQSQQDVGYVYLMKSGKHYKIGRTAALGRREYEIRIQLPDKLTTVHTIKTDDPAGIEAYWHNRFRDRRKNGEWFELTAGDVSAFKRRKFM